MRNKYYVIWKRVNGQRTEVKCRTYLKKGNAVNKARKLCVKDAFLYQYFVEKVEREIVASV